MKQTQRLLLAFLLFATVAAKAQQTVTIGTQTWMLKNLDVTTYRDGTTIPAVTDANAWSGLTTGAWCWYQNNSGNDIIYGKLYNWYAVNDSRGLCPAGYHVPSDAEWTTLSDYLGGQPSGGKMKEAGLSHWNSPNTGADNLSGFTGLPGGTSDGLGLFSDINSYGYWWSSTDKDANNAYFRYLSFKNGDVGRNFEYNKTGFSVRCLHD